MLPKPLPGCSMDAFACSRIGKSAAEQNRPAARLKESSLQNKRTREKPSKRPLRGERQEMNPGGPGWNVIDSVCLRRRPLGKVQFARPDVRWGSKALRCSDGTCPVPQVLDLLIESYRLYLFIYKISNTKCQEGDGASPPVPGGMRRGGRGGWIQGGGAAHIGASNGRSYPVSST